MENLIAEFIVKSQTPAWGLASYLLAAAVGLWGALVTYRNWRVGNTGRKG